MTARTGVWVGLILATVLVVGCGPRATEPPAATSPSGLDSTVPLLAQGKQALEVGQYAQAATAFQQVLTARPDRLEARLYLGRCAYQQGQYNEATHEFLAVVTGHPRSAEGWLGLGQCYEAQQRAEEALRCYREALHLQPQAETARQGILRLGQVKRIAVTIDDGPSLAYSLRAMDVAEKYGGRVTFFVTGIWAAREPQIVRSMSRRGHEVENHTWHHVNLTRCSPEQVREELQRTSDLIVQQGGAPPQFLRPPYGAHNALVDRLAGEQGLKVVMWDLDTEDWRAGNSGARTVSYIGSHARPNAVILMHQVHNTYTVLEEIFRTLHEQGYTCVRLDELPRYPANIGG